MRLWHLLASQSSHATPTDPPDGIAAPVGAREDGSFAPLAAVVPQKASGDAPPIQLVQQRALGIRFLIRTGAVTASELMLASGASPIQTPCPSKTGSQRGL